MPNDHSLTHRIFVWTIGPTALKPTHTHIRPPFPLEISPLKSRMALQQKSSLHSQHYSVACPHELAHTLFLSLSLRHTHRVKDHTRSRKQTCPLQHNIINLNQPCQLVISLWTSIISLLILLFFLRFVSSFFLLIMGQFVHFGSFFLSNIVGHFFRSKRVHHFFSMGSNKKKGKRKWEHFVCNRTHNEVTSEKFLESQPLKLAVIIENLP